MNITKKFISVILAAIMICSLFMFTVTAAEPYSDVSASRWSYDAIIYATEKGYMNGTGEGKFDPDATMTRAMVVTVLWRIEGEPEVGFTDGFTDVKSGKWFSDAVIWAKNNSIVNGVSEDVFDPDGQITREQLTTMLYRFCEYKQYVVTGRADLSSFKDQCEIHSYAKDAVAWAVDVKLIHGVTADSLQPRSSATREQFATILQRFDNTRFEIPLSYNAPLIMNHYTEPEYPLVDDADFYVATDGSDKNPGTFDRPFATMNKAVEAVRELKSKKTDGDIKVAFKTGEYKNISVDMTNADSGTPEQKIIYCKYGDGDVIFNNGIDFTTDSFESLTDTEKYLFNDKHTDNIKKMDVSSVFEAGINEDTLTLFSDNGLCVTARFPNKNLDGSDSLLEGGADTYSDTSLLVTHTLFKRRLAGYSEETISAMNIYGYIIRGYRKDTFKIASFDPDTNILEIENWETSEFGHMRPDWEKIKMCLTNVSKELDTNGEYWINPNTRILYVYAPEGNYHIALNDTMINMDNTDDITYRGLTFKNSTGRFIYGNQSHGVTIELCDFNATTSKEGVYFYDCSKTRNLDLVIRNNTFANAYGHSVKVDGRCIDQDRYVKNANVIFDNNLVKSSNLVYDFENAINMIYCSDLAFTHNRFEHCSRGAISFSKSYNVLVEYNDFDSVMENSEDGGAIYSDCGVDGRHIVVRHNFFNYMRPYGTGTYGYYVDDSTAGAEIYANLFYNAACPVMIHKGRDNFVHDNVFINTGSLTPIGLSINQRNDIDRIGIEVAKNPPIEEWDLYQTRSLWRDVFTYIEKYPEYRKGVEKWCPEILNYHLDYDNIDDPNFVMNPVNTIKNNVYINNDGSVTQLTDKYHIQYITIEGERGYTREENLFFINPTLGDYRLKDDADIMNIEFEKIGRH